MQRLIWTIIAAFAMTVVLGPIMIPWLKKLKFGQTIYDLGPESHKKKQGTPTMGGVIFAIPALIAAVAFGYGDTRFDYLQTAQAGLAWVDSPFLCYDSAVRVAATDGQVLAHIYEPWFDRTYAKYCSHMNTPYKEDPAEHIGGLRKGSVVYLPHRLCAMYHKDGAQLFRDVLVNALKLVYTPKARIDLPSGGRNRLTLQKAHNRYVLHMGYATPVQRGRTSVLEDMVPLHGVSAEIDLQEGVGSVVLQPQNQSIEFSQKEGVLRFAVPEVRCHQVIEINLN